MRTFAQKQNQCQVRASSSLARSHIAKPAADHRTDLILHLQLTIGNQAVQRMLQTHAGEHEARSAAAPSPRLGHDFSWIPIHSSPPAGAIQTKLATNKLGDKYEQEPAHVANEIMRMPEAQLQRANEVLAAPGQPLDSATSAQAPKSRTHRSWLRSRVGRWSEQSMENLWQSAKTAPTPSFVTDVMRSPGKPLDSVVHSVMETRFDHDFSSIRIHTDDQAASSAERLGAAAYSAGRHLVFARGQYTPDTESGRHLLAHELAHVVQRQGQLLGVEQEWAPTLIVRNAAAEQEADAWAAGRTWTATPVRLPSAAVLPSIAEKILKFAAKQLEKRTVRTVSKHIARHAQRIAGRAIHSIFKNPKEIRYLLQRMVREATEIAAKHPTAGTQHVIEEAGIRITRQTTGTPGKFRLLIQKVFDREIGTQGERVLRVVLDQTGRIVTAFPADRLAAIGLTAAGIEALTEGTARAGEAAQTQVARAEAAQRAREERFDIWEWVPLIGDIWGGSLNEGEDEMLRQEREIAALVNDTIDDVEKSEQRTLGESERRDLEQLIRAAIASPLVMNDPDPE